MAGRALTDADRTAFQQFIERSISDGMFARSELNTATLHCLIAIGCQGSTKLEGKSMPRWQLLLGNVVKTARELAWIHSQSSTNQVPVLADSSLLALCSAVALPSEQSGFAIDEAKSQITSHRRPLAKQVVPRFVEFKNQLRALDNEKLASETESLYLLASMQPRTIVLFGNGFSYQQPEVTMQQLDEVVVPAFDSVKENFDQHRFDLNILLPHMRFNFEACGMAEWATQLSQDSELTTEMAATRAWSRKEFRTHIAALHERRNELLAWVPPAVAADFATAVLPSKEQLAVADHQVLKQWWERARSDVQILCEKQPNLDDRLTMLNARLALAQSARETLLPLLSTEAVNSRTDVREAARLIAEPNLLAYTAEEKAKRFAEYLSAEEKRTAWLAEFTAVGAGASDLPLSSGLLRAQAGKFSGNTNL